MDKKSIKSKKYFLPLLISIPIGGLYWVIDSGWRAFFKEGGTPSIVSWGMMGVLVGLLLVLSFGAVQEFYKKTIPMIRKK